MSSSTPFSFGQLSSTTCQKPEQSENTSNGLFGGIAATSEQSSNTLFVSPTSQQSSGGFNFPPYKAPASSPPEQSSVFGKALTPSTSERPSSPGFPLATSSAVSMSRSTLREELNTVIKLLHLWSNYPYLVLQELDSGKIEIKELWESARAIVDAKDKIVVACVQRIMGGK